MNQSHQVPVDVFIKVTHHTKEDAHSLLHQAPIQASDALGVL